MVGTPNWMAPEVLRVESYREASDVYSFGVIVWEIVTGQIPYHGLSLPQIRGIVGSNSSRVLPSSFLLQFLPPSLLPSLLSLLECIAVLRGNV